jgi:NAD(P)-dependent dehydrogenase (short-subunit alcohol dehydrogenase family)
MIGAIPAERGSPAIPGLDFRGKVVIVTGASRGIGRAIASGFANAGAAVMLTSRRQEALEMAAADIGGTTAVHAGNAGDPATAVECVAATVERFGSVDVLVNNAATNPYYGPVVDIDDSRYDKTFAVNVKGALSFTQEAWKSSMQARGGAVINIASIGGLLVEPSIGIYNLTKAALIHLTKTLAAELSPNVRVNAIAPGLIKTDLSRALWENGEEELASAMPLGRLGEPDDVAHAALFLASDYASWITGHTLVIDGGWLVRPS